MSRNDGGPAFPVDCNWQDGVPTSGVQTSSKTGMATGMTLRDYFAAKAMQALINAKGEPLDRIYEVPEYSYEIADAMIAARGGA